MHTRLTLLLLFLMFSAAFAVAPIENLVYVVPLVAVMVVILLAMANMMSTALGEPKLQAWAKAELREFIAGLILIAIIIAAFIGSNGVSIALTGESDFVQVSVDTVNNWIQNYDAAFQYLIRAAAKIRASATYSPYINVPLWWVSFSYSGSPIGGVSIMLVSLSVASQGLTNVTFIYEAVRMLVLYLKVVVPDVLLPLAFIVRLIPFTRKAGNTLIALSLAAIVFLPFSIIMADSFHGLINFPEPRINNIEKLQADPWAMVVAEPLCESEVVRTILSLTDPLFAILVCFPLFFIPIAGPGLFNACKPVIEYVVYPIIQVVFQVVMALLLVIWSAYFAAAGGEDYAKDVFDTTYPFLRDVNNLVLMGYLDFILIAIITVSGAKSLSAAIGGEWYMAGVQRLI